MDPRPTGASSAARGKRRASESPGTYNAKGEPNPSDGPSTPSDQSRSPSPESPSESQAAKHAAKGKGKEGAVQEDAPTRTPALPTGTLASDEPGRYRFRKSRHAPSTQGSVQPSFHTQQKTSRPSTPESPAPSGKDEGKAKDTSELNLPPTRATYGRRTRSIASNPVGPPATVSDAADPFESEFMSDEVSSEPDVRMEIDIEDEKDELFVPDFNTTEPNRRREVTEPSPKKRIPVGASILPDAKERVRITDPHRGQCLLTGTDPNRDVQWAHLLHRATKGDELTTIEWHFGMPYYTFFIDTRFNLVALRADLHILMDADQWTFVPDYQTIRIVLEWLEKVHGGNSQSNPIAKLWVASDSTKEHPMLKIHQYYMLPLHDALKTVALYRRANVSAPFDANVAEQRHTFPFNKVGRLSSHVQPHFAIYAAGKKLAAMEKKLTETDFTAWLNTLATNTSFGHPVPKKVTEASTALLHRRNLDSLRDIQRIYTTWTDQGDLPKKNDKWYTKPKK
ncbi:hypothetical protein FB451DRAFT_1221985 [Mycena latifolia]|nr:hypothetical protein FB451DRAFT_1221985 [Mycena latifolia]